MTNHTPGPWYIEQFAHPYGKTEDRTITGYTRTGNPLRIGRAYNVMGPNETDANARLIAAAPDMLEALKIAQEQYENFAGAGKDDGTLGVINSAIAKATGH
jgi:hypothetical protein